MNLDPPAATGKRAGPRVDKNGCQARWPALETPNPCVYGDRSSRTSVVLFGDSHASSWFPALNLISKKKHWRLLILTKAGCSPPDVILVHHGWRYTECTTWRQNTEAEIAALHPALVIVSWARWLSWDATAEPGVPTPYASPWLNGVKATFDILRTSATHVIFISDVPLLTFGAPGCVAHHRSDVRPCNDSPRATSFFDPALGTKEIELARQAHVSWIDPASWFCSPTICPVVVGHFLLYRDNAHFNPPWSRFIAPVLGHAIDSLLSARGRRDEELHR